MRPDDGPRWKSPGTVVALAVAVAVLLRIGVLRVPFLLDDFLQQAMTTGNGWAHRAAWDRSRLVSGAPEEVNALVAQGRLPWWSDERLRIAPFRPLASLEHGLAYALHGANPVAAHAVSLFWLALLVVAAWVLYRSTLPGRAATIAILFYALSRAHVTTVAWLANRCALIAATFTALAVHAHIRFRNTGDGRARLASVAFLAGALLSAEYALAAFGFLLAYELFESNDPLPTRVRALLPSIAVGVAYFVAFLALGYGARSTVLYADPSTNPLRFLVALANHLPDLCRLSFFPWSRGGGSTASRACGVALALVTAFLLFSRNATESTKRGRWWFVAGLLAFVPVTSTWPDYRLIGLPMLAFHGAFGTLIAEAITERRVLSRAFAVALTALHGVVAPIGAVRDLKFVRTMHGGLMNAALRAPLEGTEDAVVLSAVDVFTLHYPPIVRLLAGLPSPRHWWVLACTRSAYEATRTGPDEIELHAREGNLLDARQAGVYRDAAHPLPAAGTTLRRGQLSVTILETGPQGPTRLRFRFPESLDDPRFTLLFLGPEGFERFWLPPNGVPLPVPRSPDD